MSEKTKDLVEDMREKLEDPKARAIALQWTQRKINEIEKEEKSRPTKKDTVETV